MKREKDETKSIIQREFGGEILRIVPLPGAGGDRRYSRIWFHADGAERTVLSCRGNDRRENAAFCRLSAVFRENGIDVPEVYAEYDDGCGYLLEDLGGESLMDVIKREGEDGAGNLVAETLEMLARMQRVPLEEWQDIVYEKDFGRRIIFRDLNYFKYDFLKPAHIAYDEDALEDDFERLAQNLEGINKELWGFMMRDCQSRNVMVRDGKPSFIDFQGGFYGPGLYDAVSLLWQAKAGFSAGFRLEMLEVYARAASETGKAEPVEVLANLSEIVVLRLLQVMGAYGFRGLIEKRAHFIESIRLGIRNLSEASDEGMLDAYPELKRIAGRLADSERFKAESDSQLTVKVYSFSYKRGYPEDLTGNGGGFMFDCRAMHNPGRYAEYRELTGMDKPVVDFLEERGEVFPFLKAAEAMVVPAVERYERRGFSSLQVGFGCTGGQHRSVYCAEALARKIAEEFPGVRVRLVHREQGKELVYNDKGEYGK